MKAEELAQLVVRAHAAEGRAVELPLDLLIPGQTVGVASAPLCDVGSRGPAPRRS